MRFTLICDSPDLPSTAGQGQGYSLGHTFCNLVIRKRDWRDISVVLARARARSWLVGTPPLMDHLNM